MMGTNPLRAMFPPMSEAPEPDAQAVTPACSDPLLAPAISRTRRTRESSVTSITICDTAFRCSWQGCSVYLRRRSVAVVSYTVSCSQASAIGFEDRRTGQKTRQLG